MDQSGTAELALSVIFESAIQYFAQRIEGYRSTPQFVQDSLKTVHVACDETWFVDGNPGEFTVLARGKNRNSMLLAFLIIQKLKITVLHCLFYQMEFGGGI